MKKFLLIFFVGIFVIAIIFCGIVLFKYNSWKKEFNKEGDNISCFSNIHQDSNIDTSEKIKDFVLSSSSGYLQFSIDETLSFLHNDVKVSEGMNIEDICINPSKGEWTVYINIKVENFDLPWIKLNVIKDERETVELYVSEISLGDMKIPDILANGILDEINRGISDGILIVNENNFLGKNITNIELLNDGVVIR